MKSTKTVVETLRTLRCAGINMSVKVDFDKLEQFCYEDSDIQRIVRLQFLQDMQSVIDTILMQMRVRGEHRD